MEHRRSIRSFRGAALTALASALVIATAAGCTSSSVPSDDGASSDGAGGDGETLSVTVSRGAVNIENVLLAQQEGYFEEAGLDLEMLVNDAGGGGAATNSALVAGEFDIGATDAVTAIRAINENIPIVIVAGTKSAKPDYEGPVSDGLIVPPGSDIAEWSDLSGAKIGVPEIGGLPYLTVVTGLAENGISVDDVEIVPLPLDTLVASAATGQVDAIFTFSIFMLSALDEGFERVGTGVREFLPYAPQSLWVATAEFAEANPEVLTRFRDALIQGTEYGNENPDAVRDIYHEYTELPAPFIDDVMILEPLDVEFQPEGWETLLGAMKDAGEVRDDLTYEECVWEGAR
ncbi:MAG: ABC transporter substrate-binding protein [Pseudoclavibacter sp.]